MDSQALENHLEAIEKAAIAAFESDDFIANCYTTGTDVHQVIECGIRIGKELRGRVINSLKSPSIS